MWHPIKYPWEAIEIASKDIPDLLGKEKKTAWYSQIVTGKKIKITNAVTGNRFPTRAISNKSIVIELPGPALKGDMSRAIILDLDHGKQIEFSYFYENNTHDKSEMNKYELFFDTIMNGMLFILSKECLNVKNYKSENKYWHEVLEELHKNIKKDPGKYALVVELSEFPSDLIRPIDRITENPKRILQRIHDQERIQKVREIDIKCIIDLARRPGRLLPEKAGPKQRILAIKRMENINTLENRVTRHCCSLAVKASKRYLLEHENIQKSKRKGDVKKLQKECKRLPNKSTFSSVLNLIEPCRQPNYTLMENADYYKVWKAYIQLVRNEDLRAELWQWNRRMWVEYCALFLVDILKAFQSEMTDKNMIEIGKKTIFGKRKHDSGFWFVPDALPGPFILESVSSTPGTLYFIQGDRNSLTNLSESLSELSSLNADYLFIYIRNNENTVLPVYGIIPHHHLSKSNRDKYIHDMLPSLSRNIRTFNTVSSDWTCKNGWVLLGNWDQNKTMDNIQNLGKGIKCWTSAVDPDYRQWAGNRENNFGPLRNIFSGHN